MWKGICKHAFQMFLVKVIEQAYYFNRNVKEFPELGNLYMKLLRL